jgi:hypothetical protein
VLDILTSENDGIKEEKSECVKGEKHAPVVVVKGKKRALIVAVFFKEQKQQGHF